MNVRNMMLASLVIVTVFSSSSWAVECCPANGQADCNGNCVPDACDLDCGNSAGFCGRGGALVHNLCDLGAATCGDSLDCNGNGVPDECDPDCDGDGLPDDCEADCDNDGLPDDCEADVNINGIPDDCEPNLVQFSVYLDGPTANDCHGTDSPATGSGLLTLDWATDPIEVHYIIEISDLVGEEIAAHVHGEIRVECGNAPARFGLVPGPLKIGMFTIQDFLVDDFVAGLFYILIHTDYIDPGGEIRGPVLEVPSELLTVVGGKTLGDVK